MDSHTCIICDRKFSFKCNLKQHVQIHTGEKPHRCEICGTAFTQKAYLKSHQTKHSNDKPYKCDDCGKDFKQKRLLTSHINNMHTDELPYVCEICGKAFGTRVGINDHRFIHSDKKKYECLVCGMSYMKKPLLYAHMDTQGHVKDEIIVNEPRLTDDRQMINIQDNDIPLMEEAGNGQLDETGLNVTELKDHMIMIQQEGEEQIYNIEDILNIGAEETVSGDHLVVENLVGWILRRVNIECKTEIANQLETVYTYNENEEGETIVVPVTSSYKDGEDKNVRLVQIRFPTSVDGEGRSWLSLYKILEFFNAIDNAA